MHVEERGAAGIPLDSICAVVPGFYHQCQNQRNQVHLSFRPFRLKKVHFLHCFIQNWEEIESLKNERSPGVVLEKSWNSVFPFPYEP